MQGVGGAGALLNVHAPLEATILNFCTLYVQLLGEARQYLPDRIGRILNRSDTGCGSGGYWLCMLLLSESSLWTATAASKINLMIVTVERYLKVVHPVCSKKKLRKG